MNDEQLYRPTKKAISLRLDSDVLVWFRSIKGKYQSHINRVLRKYMEEQKKTARKLTTYESSTNPPLSRKLNTSGLLIRESLFFNQSTALRSNLAEHGFSRKFKKGVILITEGDRPDSIYFILSGRVKAFMSDESGREVIIDYYGPGEYFGELEVFDRSPRSISVETLEASEISVMTGDEFLRYLYEDSDVVLEFIQNLIKRNRELLRTVKNFALLDVYGRIAYLLSDFSMEIEGGTRVIEERLTHKDIADMVGASREMVSLIMKDLSKGGYIETKDNMITIYRKLPPRW